MKYLQPEFTRSEKDDLEQYSIKNSSFYTSIRKKRNDCTASFFREVDDITHGMIPRNFILNIRGGIGRKTGIFKSTLGIQMAMKIDPTFNVDERLGMTPNELNEKIKKYADKKQVFVVDEYVIDMKQSAENRLRQIAVSCRERELTFILIGAMPRYYVESDYYLERLGESSDKYMNKKVFMNIDGKKEMFITGNKTVYYSLCKYLENNSYYRGYIKFDITPLTDDVWRGEFEKYMNIKRIHQQKAIDQQLTGFDFKRESINVKNNIKYDLCFVNGKLSKPKLKNLIYELYPDITNQERNMIYVEMI